MTFQMCYYLHCRTYPLQRYFFNFCMMELMNFVLIFLNHWATDMFLQGGLTGFGLLKDCVFMLSRHRCFLETLSSLLSFPANQLAQKLLGKLDGQGRQQQESEKRQKYEAEDAPSEMPKSLKKTSMPPACRSAIKQNYRKIVHILTGRRGNGNT